MTDREKLTDEERRWLESDPEFQRWDVRRKVLRIIDAHEAIIAHMSANIAAVKHDHEANRAALVKELAQCQRDLAECAGQRNEALEQAREQAIADVRAFLGVGQ